MRFNKKSAPSSPQGHISRKEKFFLAMPIPAASLSGVLIHNVYIKLYTDLIGLEPVYVGLVYLIYNIWNFINDPLIGVFIDRKKVDPKRGKFLHIMRVSVPFMILCLIAMLLSQPTWPQWLIFSALLIELFIFDTFATAYTVSANSLILVAAASKEERVDVNVIQSYIANIVSFFATLVPTFLLVGNRDGNYTQVTLVLMAVVALNAALYYWALYNLKEKAEYYAHGTPEDSLHLATLWEDIKVLFKSRAFRAWAGYNLLALAPNAVYFTAFLYLMDHVIHSGGLEATLADVIPMLVVFALLPFMAKFIKNQGGKRAIFWGSLPYIIGHLTLFISRNWLAVLLSYIPIMIGKYLMSTSSAPLGAAIVDENERLTGIRKPGLIGALLALIAAPALSTQLMIFMGILEGFGYNKDLAVQSEHAMLGIRFGTAIVPIIFVILGLIPLVFFPINQQKEEELSRFSQQMRRGNDSGNDSEGQPA